MAAKTSSEYRKGKPSSGTGDDSPTAPATARLTRRDPGGFAGP
jgi:hypothetical protein